MRDMWLEQVPAYAGYEKHTSAFSRHHAPELCQSFRPSREGAVRPSREGAVRPSREGAGKTGCALHPRSHVQGMHKQTHMSIQVQRKQSGLPCAMVLTVSFVLFLATGFLSPSSPRSLLLRNLTPASGRQNHTTSPSTSRAVRQKRIGVHRISPRRS